MHSVELFAGAGGLAIGMANAGFQHAAVVEWDHYACETFRENQRHHAHAVEGWPVHETDARTFNFSSLAPNIAVVSGGPPCQPFSMGGKHQGQRDERDMFPQAVRAVRELMPKAFIFENVKGLMRESFAFYFSYIHLQLQYPEIVRRKGEEWIQHRSRLEKHHSSNKNAPTYNVLFDILNSADFGIPQKRERVFFVGFRSDLGVEWSFPQKTHSEAALLISKWIDGTYWDEHGLDKKRMLQVPPRYTKRVLRLSDSPNLLELKRWRTTRDALIDLPDPETHSNNGIANHVFTPGARTYVGHTGELTRRACQNFKSRISWCSWW